MARKRPHFNSDEKRNILIFCFILFFRMFSVFMILPLFSYLAVGLADATPFLVGLAFGAYGLTQGLFQVPFGLWSDITSRKKALLCGLLLFSAGSLLSALSDSIHLMILGRLLQGTGAVSAIIFAMIADGSRPEVRTSANAFLGMSIGLAFILSFIFAPLIANYTDLQGIFLIIFFLSIICFVIAAWLIKDAPREEKERHSVGKYLKTALKQRAVYEIYFGAFVVGFSLTLFLFNTQMDFRTFDLDKEALWKIYVPVLLISTPVMFASAFRAQKHYKFKEVINGGIYVLAITYLFYLFSLLFNQELMMSVITLVLFFVAFNFFEPIFPSLLTIKVDQTVKGTASGYFNLCQFFGNFTGSLIAGLFFQIDRTIPLYIGLFLILGFYLLNRAATNPIKAKPVA